MEKGGNKREKGGNKKKKETKKLVDTLCGLVNKFFYIKLEL